MAHGHSSQIELDREPFRATHWCQTIRNLSVLPTILVGILFGLAMDSMLFLGSECVRPTPGARRASP
jgi:hypothetical protein